MLFSCLVGLVGGDMLGRPKEPAKNVAEFFSAERRPFTIKAAGLFITFVGSLMLQAVGLAIGGELPRSGRAAIWSSLTITLLWCVCGIILLTTSGGRLAGAFFMVLALIGAALVLFSVRAKLLMDELPPVDRRKMVHEALDAYERHRRERGRMI